MHFLKRHIWLVVLLIIGGSLRFGIAATHSYSNDELSAINRLRYDSFGDLIEFGVMKGDMHPAGVEVGMKIWSWIAGVDEFGMRFPFVIFGLLSIVALYFMGLKWFNQRTGIFAAGLLTVLYFPIMNSEFARPYSPGLLIALVVGWYMHKILFCEVKKWKNAIILGVLMALGMYTHYFCFLFLAWMGLTGLFFLNKENIRYYLVACGLAVLLFLPHYSVTYFHLNVGGLQWLGAPEADWLLQFIFHVFNESLLVHGAMGTLLLASIFYVQDKVDFRNKYVLLCVFWFFGIYLVGHLVSVTITPLLKFPVMLFALPYLLLLIGLIVSQFKFYKIAVPLVLGVGLTSTVVEKDLFGNMHFGLFEEIAVHITDWEKEYGEENIYTVYNLSNPDYMNFYARRWNEEIDFDWDVIEFSDDYQIRRDLFDRDEEFCIVGYSARLTLVNVFETARNEFPYVVDGYTYNNSAVYLLSKNEADANITIEEEMIASFPDTPKGAWNYVQEKSVMSQSGLPLYQLDSSNIYGPDFTFQSTDFEDSYLKVLVCAMAPANSQLTVTISGERNGELIQHRNENFWIGHDLEDAVNSDNEKGILIPRCTQYSCEIPEFIEEGDQLKLSFWNRNGSDIWIGPIGVYAVENIWN